jgi:1-deoxy-D-xylulose-5-phosphate synthase
LRAYGGLSGFPKPEESGADCFITGHASASISAALGFAQAARLSGEDYSTVAVIGDGALTGGLAYEGLNNAGALKLPLIVILNDNKMSIGGNVGAISNYLVKIRTGRIYSKAKQEIEGFLKAIPRVGAKAARLLDRLKDSLKYFLVDGIIFEELGFTYLGPINGHDIEEMTATLKRAKNMKKPVIIHVKTIKGKGYAPAEKNPDMFHGIGAFNIESGESLNHAPLTFTEVFGAELCALAEKDAKIAAVSAAMISGAGLEDFFRRFPERSFDVGIAESHALTFSAALAAAGLKPVAAIYSTFIQRAYDQILNDICLPSLPVVMAIDRSGIAGEDGPTHNGVFDLSFLRTAPNLTLMAPKNGAELKEMLRLAIAHNGPTAIRYPKGGANSNDGLFHTAVKWGEGELLREGGDIILIACGPMSYIALDAARLLEKSNIQAGVINTRFINPLDEKLLLKHCLTAGKAAVIEENSLRGGLATACAELFVNLNIKLLTLSLPYAFMEQGKREELLCVYGLTGEKAAAAVINAFFKSGGADEG